MAVHYCRLLLETGDALLLETGDTLLLDPCMVTLAATGSALASSAGSCGCYAEDSLSGSTATPTPGTLASWVNMLISGTSSPVIAGTAVATDATPDPARFGHYKAGRRRP